MSNDTPRLERVTLTDAEREALLSPESLRDEVAAVLAEHAPIASCDEGEWHCACGPVRCLAADCDGGSWADCHAAHLADALLASPALARVIRERESACGCTPGTEENGWHETRCSSCAAQDRRQWADAMEKSKALGDLIREARAEAWDEGRRDTREGWINPVFEVRNPYREEQP